MCCPERLRWLHAACWSPESAWGGRSHVSAQAGGAFGSQQNTAFCSGFALLSRQDAERIAKRLVALAKSGDSQAVKLLLGQPDGPLSQATAIALANAPGMPAVDNVTVGIVDNGRGDYGKPPFHHKGIVPYAHELPSGDTTPPAEVTVASPASEPEPDGETCDNGTIDGETFLREN